MERSRRPTSARRSTKQPSTRVRQEEQLSNEGNNNNNNNVEGETKKEELQCGICLESIEVQGILNSCQHLFCFTCIDHWSKTANTCPMCKARFKQLTKIELGKPEVKPKKFKIKDADQHPEYSDPESWVVWEDDDDDEIELPFPPFPLFASLFGFSMMPGPLSVSFSTSGLVNMRFFPAPSSSAFPIFPPLLPLLSSIFSGDDDDEDEDEFDVDIEEQPRRRPTTTSRSARTSRSRLSARGSARQPSTRSSRASTSTAARSSSRPSTSSTRSSTSSTTRSDETPASSSATSPSTTTTTTTTRTRTSETRVERNPTRSRSRRSPY